MAEGIKNRDTEPRPGSPLWIYLAVVTILGAAVLALAMSRLTPADIQLLASSPAFWIVAGLICFGELRPIVTPGSTEEDGGTTSTIFTFALLLHVGLPVAALLQAAATVLAGVLTRKAPFRTAFNVAQYCLSLGAAALILRLFEVSPSPADPWVVDGAHLLMVGLAAAAYFVANDGLVGTAVALHEREPIARTLRSDLAYQALVNVALLSMSPIVVVIMNRAPALLSLLVLPLVAVYTNASISLKREHQAHHDGLTGLPNRKLLITRAAEALSDAHRYERRVGLLLLDLDRFKEVNDTLGHPTGDRLLQLVAYRLRHGVRPGDIVARLGGDEFAVLLPSVRDTSAAREVAARVRAALAEPFRLDGMFFHLEASIGVALCPDHAPDCQLLLQRADVAMYVAKERRLGVAIYDAAKDRNSPARLGLLGELRRAIDRGELDLHYQPKVSVADGEVLGMEALVRWHHPARGLILPEEFVPLAEQSYLMRSLTSYVVERALAQAAEWWADGLRVQIAVNISARDLLDSNLVDVVSAGLLRHDIPPTAVQMEITERVFMNEPGHAMETIEALAGSGIALALDDFGTGYSSLVRLRRLPVREIKIDASFVRRLANGGDDAVIVASIIDLARALGISSVAEGVESEATLAALRGMDCDAAQGWHLGRPMEAGRATAWLAERVPRQPLQAEDPFLPAP
ncbi:MAG: EAL domain-containing protein [Streptosporangiales bacterium]|nr:EAL domain-containing protein [Streptosporangiales bacterium]